MELASTIRAARTRSGLSQRELARRARTSHATLCAYEKGRVEPGAGVLQRIVEAAGFEMTITLAPALRTTSGRDPGQELAEVLALAEHFPHERRSRTLEAPIFPRS